MKLRSSRALLLALASTLVLSAQAGRAATPTFTNISQDDFDKITRELSANSSFHSVTPPSSMGSLFGFELGVVAGGTRTPDIDAFVKEASPGTDANMFPHAGLLAAVTVPMAITGELIYFPQLEASGVKFQNFGIGVKWVPTDSILGFLPLNIAVRGFLTKTELSFSQTINNSTTGGTPVSSSINYEGQVTGLQVLASPKLLPIIEPYIGVGVLQGKGKMSSSVGSFFDTASSSAESTPSSTQFLLGADVRLLLIGIGLEYSRAFGTDSYTGKFSLKF